MSSTFDAQFWEKKIKKFNKIDQPIRREKIAKFIRDNPVNNADIADQSMRVASIVQDDFSALKISVAVNAITINPFGLAVDAYRIASYISRPVSADLTIVALGKIDEILRIRDKIKSADFQEQLFNAFLSRCEKKGPTTRNLRHNLETADIWFRSFFTRLADIEHYTTFIEDISFAFTLYRNVTDKTLHKADSKALKPFIPIFETIIEMCSIFVIPEFGIIEIDIPILNRILKEDERSPEVKARQEEKYLARKKMLGDINILAANLQHEYLEYFEALIVLKGVSSTHRDFTHVSDLASDYIREYFVILGNLNQLNFQYNRDFDLVRE